MRAEAHLHLTEPTRLRIALAAIATGVGLLATVDTQAAAPTVAPQVLLAITNSESMDGTTGGAIMTGSGGLGSSFSSLTSSSSPTNYLVPSGFTPPVQAAVAGYAPYTAGCNGYQCDNSQSRLNMTKAAIAQVLSSYGSSLNFGVYTYSTGTPSLYSTWVYYMSPSGGFTFTNTASSTTVANPCFNYSTAPTAVKNACASIAGQYAANVMATNAYMTIAASSDDAQINDVLYTGTNGITPTLLTYGTVSPANPYTYYALSTYNTNIGGYSESYSAKTPGGGSWSTTPTNAGYVPFSPQVLYAQRGFGYGASQSATTGSAKVAMGTDPATSSAFTTALAPETSNASSAEIKSVAGQSAIYGLMNGAKSYLAGLTKATCQTQYVVLLTDGLPTLDKSGNAWPPLGTTTGNAYNLKATYNADGSFQSSNSQAVTDAIASITALSAAGVKTYVIGLGAGVDKTVNLAAYNLLQAMAIAGGTSNYYAAGDSNSLNSAFLTIIDQIYSENSVSAPIAPISVSNGSSFTYDLTSIPSPTAGHVKAYAVAASGVVSSTAAWDAPTKMTVANRTTALMAAKSDNSIVTLSALATAEPAVFNLTATTCVPTVATIVNYTIDPSYAGTCSYLAGRQANWFLGSFSTQNTGHYVPPPSSGLLALTYGSYVTYARANASRAPMLMFTDNDGFLYAVDAAVGTLRWAWMSRNLLPKLQNYATFSGADYTDGNFTIVDAMDSGGAWGSYVVGSMQSGAEHFALKLDSTGKPTSVVYDTFVTGGTSPGDKAGATGATPLRQPPVIVYIGNSVYQVYVITVGTTSTLYETNIVTGATTSAALSFQLSSALTLDSASNQIWMGGTNGSLWTTTLSTGNATSDLALILRTGTMVNPATGATVTNPLYVGYAEVNGAPHFYAVSPTEVEMFFVTSAGWTPEWAVTTSAGYKYGSSTWSTLTGANTLTANSVVSDFPAVQGNALIVPATVAGTGCSIGTGYYDFFGLDSGKFPTDPVLTQDGTPVTSNIRVGSGVAYTPSIVLTSNGARDNTGTSGCLGGGDCKSLDNKGSPGVTPYSWRQH